MSAMHELCRFPARPVTQDSLEALRAFLRAGVPATYTVEEAKKVEAEDENGGAAPSPEVEVAGDTTPLHVICAHVPNDLAKEELEVVLQMVLTLFEFGAGWSLVDPNGHTPGCILNNRGLLDTQLYQQIVDAGVRAELLLRKINDGGVEFLEEIDEIEDENEDENEQNEIENEQNEVEDQNEKKVEASTASNSPEDPAGDQKTYLETPLEYAGDSLITKSQKDGVMMSWETELMRLGCESLFSSAEEEQVILNIGFGLGLMDTMIQNKNPHKHYICEAHPDVLKKLRQDGWYDKPNVVVLEGRWQEKLSELLSSGGVYFDGVYYDTFSEHYEDMLELFDFVVGLLKPGGTFSFFNGLGADRKVVYDVYKALVPIDLGDYGLACTFSNVPVPKSTLTKEKGGTSVWDDVKRSYWSCPIYYHPVIRFINT